MTTTPKQIDDGGSAFPTHMLDVPFAESEDPKHNGMSLRDYAEIHCIAGALGDHTISVDDAIQVGLDSTEKWLRYRQDRLAKEPST